MTIRSNIDLLVVTNSHRRKSVFERDRLVASVARPPGLAMEVIVRTPAEVANRLKIGDPFFREVMTKGRVLYEHSWQPWESLLDFQPKFGYFYQAFINSHDSNIWPSTFCSPARVSDKSKCNHQRVNLWKPFQSSKKFPNQKK